MLGSKYLLALEYPLSMLPSLSLHELNGTIPPVMSHEELAYALQPVITFVDDYVPGYDRGCNRCVIGLLLDYIPLPPS